MHQGCYCVRQGGERNSRISGRHPKFPGKLERLYIPGSRHATSATKDAFSTLLYFVTNLNLPLCPTINVKLYAACVAGIQKPIAYRIRETYMMLRENKHSAFFYIGWMDSTAMRSARCISVYGPS